MGDERYDWSVYAEMPNGSAVQVGHVTAATELEAMNAGGSLCLKSAAARGFVRTLVECETQEENDDIDEAGPR